MSHWGPKCCASLRTVIYLESLWVSSPQVMQSGDSEGDSHDCCQFFFYLLFLRTREFFQSHNLKNVSSLLKMFTILCWLKKICQSSGFDPQATSVNQFTHRLSRAKECWREGKSCSPNHPPLSCWKIRNIF